MTGAEAGLPMNDAARQPLVSVIIIFLNAARFIEEAIESVFAQTYENWELLLVDDGSTDASTEIAKRYEQQHPGKVRYLEHEGHINRGMSATRNLGVRHARGEFVALLDSDDVWRPEKLNQQLEVMRAHPEVSMVFGSALYWNTWPESPTLAEPDYVPEMGIEADRQYDPPELSLILYPLGKGDPPCPSDFLMRREMIARIAGFEEGFRGKYHLYEDQAFLSKVYLRERVYISSAHWILYRLHPDSCCSAAQRAGDYHDVRSYFLNWFQQRLVGQQVDGRVANALERALQEYRVPQIA